MHWARGTPARAHSVRRLRSISASCVRGTSNIKHRPAVRTPPSKSVYIYIPWQVHSLRSSDGSPSTPARSVVLAARRPPLGHGADSRSIPARLPKCAGNMSSLYRFGRNERCHRPQPPGRRRIPSRGYWRDEHVLARSPQCAASRTPIAIVYHIHRLFSRQSPKRRPTRHSGPPARTHSRTHARPHSPLLRSSALLPSRPRSPPAAGCRS